MDAGQIWVDEPEFAERCEFDGDVEAHQEGPRDAI
jgi:hypothetical protein